MSEVHCGDVDGDGTRCRYWREGATIDDCEIDGHWWARTAYDRGSKPCHCLEARRAKCLAQLSLADKEALKVGALIATTDGPITFTRLLCAGDEYVWECRLFDTYSWIGRTPLDALRGAIALRAAKGVEK